MKMTRKAENPAAIYVVGDVHGNYPKLKTALEEAGYTAGDDLIFVGDVMDRGSYNGKVARFIQKLGDKGHLVQGNHEWQHQQLLPYYQALVGFGEIYANMAADAFKFYKEECWWPETTEECQTFKCSLEERQNLIHTPATSFEDAVRHFVAYTLAWEDVRLWGIIANLLKTMCGPPYDAQHTLYEYFAGSKQTRLAMEKIWACKSSQVVVTVKGKPWKEVIVTHNNPFGTSIYSTNTSAGVKPTLYVFGHVPVKQIVHFQDESTKCHYMDIDLSPHQVGIVRIV